MQAIRRTAALCGIAVAWMSNVDQGFAQEVREADAVESAPPASTEAPASAGTATSAAAGVDEAAKSSGDAVEEIVVTAQRRKERLQDVPVTITAFTAEQLEAARVTNIESVSTRTPGFSFDAFPASQPRVSIRGVGSSDRGAAGDPSSAVFLDEIYLGRPAAVAFDAFDVERIEVLKGPQGTLYGRNVVGGAVNVITRKPDPDQFDAAADLTVGNYGRLEDAGFINVPFADGKAAVRASGAWRRHSGYVRNTYTGNDVDDQDTRSARVQLSYQPREGTRLLFSLDGTQERATGPAQHVLDLDPDSPYSAFWTVDRDRGRTAGTYDGYQNKDTWGARLQTDFDLSFGTVTYLGSYRDLDYDANYDFDGGNPETNPIDIAGGTPETSRFYSNELRLSSLPDSAAHWVVGLYSFSNNTDRQDILNLDTGGGPGHEVFDQDAKLDSYAAFADLTIPLGERVHVTGGVRYSKDEKDYQVSNTEGEDVFRASERYEARASDSWDAITYRAGADFKPSADHLLYVMVSRGFKSGGFQDTPGSEAEAETSFRPEFATQYEVGQKSSFFDGKLIWNNTIYQLDYTDLQTRQAMEDLTIVTTNAGAATVNGYETYLNWRAFAGATLMVSYGWTDATYDRYEFAPGVSFAGHRLTRVPKNKVVVSPSYEFLWSSGASLSLSADYRYESKIYDDDSNEEPEVREPTHFVDGRIVYLEASEHWSVSLWGQNLTNEETRPFQSVFLGANFGTFNAPRTYGVTLSWKF